MFVDAVLKAQGREVATLGPDADVAEAARILASQHFQIVIICDAKLHIIGVVTDSDILRAVGECGLSRPACDSTIRQLMTQDVVTCRRDDPLDYVVATMMTRGLRRIPVVERDGRVAGLITLRDALFHLYEEAKLDQALLRDYFLGLGYH